MINLNLCKQINYFVLKITVEIYRIRICIQLEYKHYNIKLLIEKVTKILK